MELARDQFEIILSLSQAEACCALGVLYNQQGDYISAVEYLERFFELARSMGDRALLDKVLQGTSASWDGARP